MGRESRKQLKSTSKAPPICHHAVPASSEGVLWLRSSVHGHHGCSLFHGELFHAQRPLGIVGIMGVCQTNPKYIKAFYTFCIFSTSMFTLLTFVSMGTAHGNCWNHEPECHFEELD